MVGDVMAKDRRAIRLYDKLGWERIGSTEHADGHGNNIHAYCYVAPRHPGTSAEISDSH